MKKRILVVDDIAYVRHVLSEILIAGGYEVVGEASSGAEAIDQYRKLKPDCVTMDLVLPMVSGVEVIQKLFAEHKNPCIVAISSIDEMSLVVEALQAGARDFVRKPFYKNEVIQAVSRALLGEGPSAALGAGGT